jgi:hypothetical protein
MQETRNSAAALSKSVSQALRETLFPSLSHFCDDLNPGVYTSSYKQRVKELAS